MAAWIVDKKIITSVPVYLNEEQKLEDKKGRGIKKLCHCSMCDYKISFVGYEKTGVENIFTFCPDCGDRMVGLIEEKK